jgi:hypothetical protein
MAEKKPATKSSKETRKAAAAKGSGKPKYKGVDETQRKKIIEGKTVFGKLPRKTLKEQAKDVRSAVKEEKIRVKTNTAKPATPKVPVKPRGGRGGMGGGVFGIKNR